MPSRLIKLLVPDKEVYEMLLMCFAKNEQRMLATLAWTMVIFNVEPRRQENIPVPRTHQQKTKAAPQAMQTAIKKSRRKAWFSGQSEAKTMTIRSLLRSHSRSQ
jgi:hypothetical protein